MYRTSKSNNKHGLLEEVVHGRYYSMHARTLDMEESETCLLASRHDREYSMQAGWPASAMFGRAGLGRTNTHAVEYDYYTNEDSKYRGNFTEAAGR